MRILFTLVSLIAILIKVNAQITITTSDLPQIEDSYTITIDSVSIGIVVPSAGTFMTWDYSSLAPASPSTASFVAASDGLLAGSFPDATMARNGSLSDLLGIAIPDPTGSGLGTDAWAFFHYGSGGLLIDGFSMPIDIPGFISGDFPFVTDNPDVLYMAPSTYGDDYSGSSDYTATIGSGEGPLAGSTLDTNIVVGLDHTINAIGWGNLTTTYFTSIPVILYDDNITVALRFQATLTIAGFTTTIFDTTIVDNLQFSRNTFIATGKGYPLLTLNKDSLGAVISAQMLYTTPSYINEPLQHELIAFPNPAHDIINIDARHLPSGDYTVKITNTLGQEVKSENIVVNSNTIIKFEGLSAGLYSISLYSNNRIHSYNTTIVIN